ncbi:transglutaminase family protein [uncultured Roseovarius sp.]|uniref:transglutaminase family protein n=1 Tax=uncultured Roseovarius sp. TaxID=293344 RepID=UPI00262AAC45|nr:transglutaminase family protein [uncultured Roseovarius sp.]
MIYTPYGEPEPSPENLMATEFFDFEDPVVRKFIRLAIGDASEKMEQAVRLFYAVRDRIRYNAYDLCIDPLRYRASFVIQNGEGYCVQKASVLIACLRAIGIPAVIGTSDVVNHLKTPKLECLMEGREIFMHHAYAVMQLNGKWIKAVPAFNIELCERMGVAPTEFDGFEHALLQQFDAQQNQNIVYLKDHGYWSDLPIERITTDFSAYYPASLIGLGSN